MHLNLVVRCPTCVYQYCVLMPKLVEIVNCLSMFDYEEKLVCLHLQVYFSYHVLSSHHNLA